MCLVEARCWKDCAVTTRSVKTRRAALGKPAATMPGVRGGRAMRAVRRSLPLIGAALVVIALMGGSVLLQARLTEAAPHGGGSYNTAAPPWTVCFSLALPLLAALALVWGPRLLRALPIAMSASGPADPLRWPQQVTPEATTHAPTATWRAWRSWLRSRPRIWLATWLATGPRTRRATTHGGSLALGILAAVVADVLAALPAARPVAQWWWAASVALVLTSAATADPPASARHTWRAAARRMLASGDLALLVILVAGSLALRLPDLTTMPYVVHGDEGAIGLQAERWLRGDVGSLIDVGWSGLPVLGYLPPALVMLVAGTNLWALRFSSVLLGTATVALLYALAREFAGRRLAFIAAALLAVAHIAIQFSRTGFHYIQAPFVVVLALWLLVRALRRESVVAAALAGVSMSLALQAYFSARIVLVIVPLFLAACWLFNRRRLANLAGRARVIGWLALSFAIAIGPIAVYFLRNPAPLGDRTTEVFILGGSHLVRDHLISQFGTADPAIVLWRQVAAVPLLLSALTDQSLQYAPPYPLFDPLVAALALVGFCYALLRFKQPVCFLLVAWVVLTVTLGVVLTIDMPAWPKVLVMVPALCLLAALAAEALLGWLEWVALAVRMAVDDALKRRRAPRGWRLAAPASVLVAVLPAVLVADLVFYSGVVSMRHYFVDFPAATNRDAYRTKYTDIGRFLATVPTGTHIVLFSGGDVIWGYDTLSFLAPRLNGQQASDARQLLAALSHAQSQPTLVIVTSSAMSQFDALRTAPDVLPRGVYTPRPNQWGIATFATYALAPAASASGIANGPLAPIAPGAMGLPLRQASRRARASPGSPGPPGEPGRRG